MIAILLIGHHIGLHPFVSILIITGLYTLSLIIYFFYRIYSDTNAVLSGEVINDIFIPTPRINHIDINYRNINNQIDGEILRYVDVSKFRDMTTIEFK